jgi:PadR family transcriptional regulator
VTNTRDPIPPGTLEMVILKTLSPGKEKHGFQIADAILMGSENILQVEEGSLYPALQRLLVKGWISGEWGRTDGNRRARYYQITKSGRKHLANEIEAYRRVSGAIFRILEPA